MAIQIKRIRHRWPESAGFVLSRPKGADDNILLHFLTPVELSIGNESFHADTGAFVIMSAGCPHGFLSKGELLHDWMHIAGDMNSLMAKYGLKQDTLYLPGITAEISEIIAYLEVEFFAQRPYWQELSECRINELLIRVAHSVANTQPQIRISDETVERLRELRARILSEPWRAWSVEELSKRVNLSQSRLHAVYKSAFGISPVRDLALIRIEKAKQMLARENKVTSVAEQLGYTSVYHFIRQFKQLVGITPKQYQLEIRG